MRPPWSLTDWPWSPRSWPGPERTHEGAVVPCQFDAIDDLAGLVALAGHHGDAVLAGERARAADGVPAIELDHQQGRAARTGRLRDVLVEPTAAAEVVALGPEHLGALRHPADHLVGDGAWRFAAAVVGGE